MSSKIFNSPKRIRFLMSAKSVRRKEPTWEEVGVAMGSWGWKARRIDEKIAVFERGRQRIAAKENRRQQMEGGVLQQHNGRHNRNNQIPLRQDRGYGDGLSQVSRLKLLKRSIL